MINFVHKCFVNRGRGHTFNGPKRKSHKTFLKPNSKFTAPFPMLIKNDIFPR